jgi:hypothetical protein
MNDASRAWPHPWLRIARLSACDVRHVLIVLAVLALSGCAHGLVGTLPNVVPADAAEIVVVRPQRFAGSAASWTITIDGAEVYAVRTGEHVIVAVPVGERIVGVKYFGPLFATEENTQTVNAESGQTYYFRLDPGFGGVSINRITAEAGRDLVSKIQHLP